MELLDENKTLKSFLSSIIGSANFTTIGLKLTRDTCAVICNKELFDSYIQKITQIKNNNKVIKVERQPGFNKEFEKYRQLHRRSQAGMVRSKQYKTLAQWLEDDTNQSVPLFFFDREHRKEEKKRSNELLKDHAEDSSNLGVKVFFTYECDENELPYKPGDVVLTTKKTGAQLDFFTFDRIIYDAGMHYIYSYIRKRYPSPFKFINSEKMKLKDKICDLYENEAEELDRSLLESLVS